MHERCTTVTSYCEISECAGSCNTWWQLKQLYLQYRSKWKLFSPNISVATTAESSKSDISLSQCLLLGRNKLLHYKVNTILKFKPSSFQPLSMGPCASKQNGQTLLIPPFFPSLDLTATTLLYYENNYTALISCAFEKWHPLELCPLVAIGTQVVM